VSGELSVKDISQSLDDKLDKLDKIWRKARSYRAMVKVEFKIRDDGTVKAVDIEKSRDAQDFEGDLVDWLEDIEFDESDDSTKVVWTFTFKR